MIIMYLYQTMDDFTIESGIPLINTPLVLIKPDEYITSNSMFPKEPKFKKQSFLNDEPSMDIIEYQSILKMKDEDDETGIIKLRISIAEKKEQSLINKERANLEKMREKQLNSPMFKYNSKCKSIIKELISKGFTETESKKYCGKCKLPAPLHKDYRPEDLSNPYKFSFYCHNCIKQGKANVNDNPLICDKKDTEYKTNYYKKHSFNYKCECGKIIRISDTAKLTDKKLEKHKESNYHQIWCMLKEQQDCSNIDYNNDIIDFKLFSVGQLRYIIKNNLNEKGKPLISSYSTKSKEELIKGLKENKNKFTISFDILDITKNKYDKKGKQKEKGYVYPDMVSDGEVDDYYSEKSSSDSDSD